MEQTLVTNQTSAINRALKIALGFMLMFGLSQVTIPLKPIPITLQTVALMLIGLTYNMKDGLAVVISYVFAGAIGVPVFANMGYGIGGPATGYLIGFIVSIYVMNKFKEIVGIDSLFKTVTACMVANIPVFAFGIAWLASFIGFEKAISGGLLPFIFPGIAKSFLLGATLRAIRGNR